MTGHERLKEPAKLSHFNAGTIQAPSRHHRTCDCKDFSQLAFVCLPGQRKKLLWDPGMTIKAPLYSASLCLHQVVGHLSQHAIACIFIIFTSTYLHSLLHSLTFHQLTSIQALRSIESYQLIYHEGGSTQHDSLQMRNVLVQKDHGR